MKKENVTSKNLENNLSSQGNNNSTGVTKKTAQSMKDVSTAPVLLKTEFAQKPNHSIEKRNNKD